MKRAAIFLAALLWISPAFADDLPAPTVFEVTGRAEILPSAGNRWKTLSEDMVLKKNSRMRTGGESGIYLVIGEGLENVLRLDENSRAEISRDARTVTLEKGMISFVVEDGEEAPPFTVRTADLKVTFTAGGISIAYTDDGTLVKVYGGSATVTPVKAGRALPAGRQARPTALGEGFKFFASAHSRATRFERMKYPDYVEWQRWTRHWYEKKDDLAADLIEKAMAREARA